MFKGQALVHPGHVLHVAGQAVHLFDNDGIEPARLGIGKQVKNAVTAMQGCPGAGLILIGRDDFIPLAPGEIPAQGNLVFGALLVLKVSAEPGVDGGTITHGCPHSWDRVCVCWPP